VSEKTTLEELIGNLPEKTQKEVEDFQNAFKEQMKITDLITVLGKHTPKEKRADMCFDLFFAAAPMLVSALARTFVPPNRTNVLKLLHDRLVPITNTYVDSESVKEVK